MTSRRKFLARGLELASGGIIAAIGAHNVYRGKSYMEIDTEHALCESTSAEASSLFNYQNRLSASLDNLASAYEAAYEKTRVVVRTVPDGDGGTRTVTSTETYWDEEWGVPNHSKIFDIRDDNRRHANGFDALANGNQLVTPESIDDVIISETNTSATQNVLVNGILYGGMVGLLLGYEELVATKKYWGQGLSMKEKVNRMNTPRQISRRSLLKVGAATVGVGMVAWHASGELGRLADQRTDHMSTILETEEDFTGSYNTAFETVTDTTPVNYIADLEYASEIVADGIDGADNARVAAAFADARHKLRDATANYNTVFQRGISEELGQHARYSAATKRLTDATFDKKLGTIVDSILEGGMVAGGMAMILLPGWYVNHHVLPANEAPKKKVAKKVIPKVEKKVPDDEYRKAPTNYATYDGASDEDTKPKFDDYYPEFPDEYD